MSHVQNFSKTDYIGFELNNRFPRKFVKTDYSDKNEYSVEPWLTEYSFTKNLKKYFLLIYPKLTANIRSKTNIRTNNR
jgi:hypothetical protein